MKYYILPSDTDMQHHGIVGQQWGHRNGPPYPLSRSGGGASSGKTKSIKKTSVSGSGKDSGKIKKAVSNPVKTSNNIRSKYDKYVKDRDKAWQKFADAADKSFTLSEKQHALERIGKEDKKLDKQARLADKQEQKALDDYNRIDTEWSETLYGDKSIKKSVKKISKMEDDLDKVYKTHDRKKINEAEKAVTKACEDLGKEICKSLPDEASKDFSGRLVRYGIREYNYLKKGKMYAAFEGPLNL